MIHVTPEGIRVTPPKNAAERLASRRDAARRFAELDPATRDITYDGPDADTLERIMGSLLAPLDFEPSHNNGNEN